MGLADFWKIDHTRDYRGWDFVRYNVHWVTATVSALLMAPILIPVMAFRYSDIKNKPKFIVSKACFSADT